MSSEQLYDTIGATYTVTRRTEPRIAAHVWAALGDARTVLNVGAGTGSYEPADRDVTAVEPSAVMRAQRPAGAARCVAATAENLPFEDESFDAAMAFATVHHWQDPIAGLFEMRRVARRMVVVVGPDGMAALRLVHGGPQPLGADPLRDGRGAMAESRPVERLVQVAGAHVQLSHAHERPRPSAALKASFGS